MKLKKWKMMSNKVIYVKKWSYTKQRLMQHRREFWSTIKSSSTKMFDNRSIINWTKVYGLLKRFNQKKVNNVPITSVELQTTANKLGKKLESPV